MNNDKTKVESFVGFNIFSKDSSMKEFVFWETCFRQIWCCSLKNQRVVTKCFSFSRSSQVSQLTRKFNSLTAVMSKTESVSWEIPLMKKRESKSEFPHGWEIALMLSSTSCPLAYRNQLADWTQAELSVCNIVISVNIVNIFTFVNIVIFINIVISIFVIDQ